MNYTLRFLLVILGSAILITACDNNKKQKHHPQIYTVKSGTIKKSLRFAGTIEPLSESVISSPIDASVEKIHFQYGQRVKKGQNIFTINSPGLQLQFNESLTEYLKAKDSFNVTVAKFSGTKDLWEAGLIAKNNYLSEKSNLNNAHMTLMRATRNLDELLEKMDDNNKDELSNLSFSAIDKVQRVLELNHNLINLKAPCDGILLRPAHTSDDKSSRITVGSSVKTGQALAIVGDLQGVRIEIDVPEVDVDLLKSGMKATVTSIAGNKTPLNGEIKEISSQATSGSGNGLPSFTGFVEVNSLNNSQKWVKVGMSANVEIIIESTNKLIIPIQAIEFKQGHSFVQVSAKDGNIKEQQITTGSVDESRVVVVHGLNDGDQIIYG